MLVADSPSLRVAELLSRWNLARPYTTLESPCRPAFSACFPSLMRSPSPRTKLFLDHRRLAYPTAIRLAHHYLFLGGTDLALSADANEATQGITRLRGWRFVVNFDNLVWEYVNGGTARGASGWRRSTTRSPAVTSSKGRWISSES